MRQHLISFRSFPLSSSFSHSRQEMPVYHDGAGSLTPVHRDGGRKYRGEMHPYRKRRGIFERRVKKCVLTCNAALSVEFHHLGIISTSIFPREALTRDQRWMRGDVLCGA